MAIDDAEKRKNVASIPQGPGVTPNAAKDAAWRQQVAGGYSGIPADNPSVTANPNYYYQQQ